MTKNSIRENNAKSFLLTNADFDYTNVRIEMNSIID